MPSRTYAAPVSVDVYTTLIDERGWTPDRVERWWHATLRTPLCGQSFVD